MSAKIFSLNRHRPVGPNRTYITRDAGIGHTHPFAFTDHGLVPDDMEFSAQFAANPEAFGNPSTVAAPPTTTSPVANAARNLAAARIATQDLTKNQAREAALQTAAALAADPDAARILQNKADHVALSIKGDFRPLPEPVEAVEPTHEPCGYAPDKPVTLWPWILVCLAVAWAIAVTPPLPIMIG